MDKIAPLIAAFRRHPLHFSAAGLALALALFFAVDFIAGAIYWSAHQNEPIQSWMTVGYIGHSWDVSPRAIDAIAGLPRPEGHPLTLGEIARDRRVPVADIIATVESAITQIKAAQK